MKMVMIAFNEEIDEEVHDLLKICVQAEYTKWTKVQGWGQHSAPHLMDHVWPQGNNVLMMCVENEKAAKIMQGIRDLRKTFGQDGVKAFLLPVDDVT